MKVGRLAAGLFIWGLVPAWVPRGTVTPPPPAPFLMGIRADTTTASAPVLLDQDTLHEISHMHVSPDRSFIVYNLWNGGPDADGFFTEGAGTANANIVFADYAGNVTATFVSSLSHGNNWPDNGGAYFNSRNNPCPSNARGGINYVTKNAVTESTILYDQYSSGGGCKVNYSDPTVNPANSNILVTGAQDATVGGSQLDLYKFDTSTPAVAPVLVKASAFTIPVLTPADITPAGYFDPKFTPDGLKVVSNTHVGYFCYHIIVVTVATGASVDLTASDPSASPCPTTNGKSWRDGNPEVSPDGQTIVFWHQDNIQNKKGIYTVPIAGGTRALVNIPAVPTSALLKMPAWDPVTPGQIYYSTYNMQVTPGVPVNRTPPAVTGTLTAGQTISAAAAPVYRFTQCASCGYAYRWYGEGFVKGGETASTYALVTGDHGSRISADVIATNSAGPSLAALSAVTEPVISTVARYVSNSVGNDSWDGTAPAFVSGTTGPWKTFANVNASLGSVKTVLFKRGDTWREQLSPTSSGTSGNPIVFDAYGTGEAPLILGSVAAASTSDWTLIGGNVWKSAAAFPPVSGQTVTFSGSPGNAVLTWGGTPAPASPVDGRGVVFYTTGTLPAGLVLGQGYFIRNASGATSNLSATPTGPLVTISSAGSGTHSAGVNGFPSNQANDAGNLIFTSGGVTQTGTTTFTIWTGQSDTNLTSQGQWYFSIADWKVHVYSTSNPATAMPGLELAIDRSGIYPQNETFQTYQNLAVKYAAAHGATIKQSSNVTMRDMYIAWIGGGNLNGDNVRYGDGIDIHLTSSNHLIERILFEQCYDAGPTLQPLNSSSPQSNIVFRNNIIKNTPQGSIAIITFGSQLSDISIYNNTAYNTANSWSETQRWGDDGSSQANQRYGLFHGSAATPVPSNYANFNNAYTGDSLSCSIRATPFTATAWQSAGPSGGPYLNYNLWASALSPAPRYCASSGAAPNGNTTIAEWGLANTPDQETNGIGTGSMVSPGYTDAAAGNFTPIATSPLRNAGTNLFSAGVVWDFSRLPRPASGPFTIGAIQ